MMKALVIALALVLVQAELRAQSATLGAHAGWDTRLDEYYVGGNGWFALGGVGPGTLLLNASANLYPELTDNSFYSIHANALLGFAEPTGTLVPFAGLGVGFLYSAPKDGATTTNYGLNISTGLLLQLFGLRPFAQGTLTIGNRTMVTAQAGLSFGL